MTGPTFLNRESADDVTAETITAEGAHRVSAALLVLFSFLYFLFSLLLYSLSYAKETSSESSSGAPKIAKNTSPQEVF